MAKFSELARRCAGGVRGCATDEQYISLLDQIEGALEFVELSTTPHTRDIAKGPTDEECAVVCMLVSNPQGALRKDGDGWQKRVNDVIRALMDERNALRAALTTSQRTTE